MAPKILFVDDEPNMRQLMALHLSNAGYEVQTAEDGIKAGYAVLKRRPDLIISDVNMPHMDGFEFVAALREDPDLRAIPVIFMTTGAEFEQRGRQLGALAYLHKPQSCLTTMYVSPVSAILCSSADIGGRPCAYMAAWDMTVPEASSLR
jgi:two-component system, chemotaxis family, chemotaxis protein CheY